MRQTLYVQTYLGPAVTGWAAAVVDDDDALESYRSAQSCNGLVIEAAGDPGRTAALAGAAALAWAGGSFQPGGKIRVAFPPSVMGLLRGMDAAARRELFQPMLQAASDLGVETRAVRGDPAVMDLLESAARTASAIRSREDLGTPDMDALSLVRTMWTSGLIETRHVRRAVIETLLGRHDIPSNVEDIVLRTPDDLDSQYLRGLVAERGETGRIAVQAWASRINTGASQNSRMRHFN